MSEPALPLAPRVLVVAESLQGKASGIGRVARLTAKVLADLADTRRIAVSALALNDAACDLGLRVETFSGSRARFVARIQSAALTHTHFVYDFAGMARAHPRWPLIFPRRASLVWMHGIEAWEHATQNHLNALRRATRVVSNTRYTLERARRVHGGFPTASICWLGTETDAEPDGTLHPAPPTPTALILGRIDAGGGYKGHRELIDVWPAVAAAVRDARLLIAGGGPGLETIRARAAASRAAASIDVIGSVAESELEALWNRSSLFAMPSRGEGFGLTYIEAMRHGLPVIASLHDAAVEVNQDEVSGYNVDLDRPGELAERLIALLGDPARRAALGGAGRARWREQFSYLAFRRRFAPVLLDFLGMSGTEPGW